MLMQAPEPMPCVVCGGSTKRVYRHPDFTVVKCRACTMAQTIDGGERQIGVSKIGSSTTPDEKLDDYRDTFSQMKERAGRSLALRIPEFERVLGRRLERVCEIGCANGVGSLAFRERGIEWLGLETDRQWIDHGKRHDIAIRAMDLDQVEGQFDLVYAQQVLEHIDQPLPFFDMIRRKLRPGGILHVAVPNHNGFTAIKRRMLPRLTPTEYGFIQYPYHLRAYNKQSLGKLFELSGYETPVVRTINHIDLCWGEWDAHSSSRLNRMIFGAGGAAGFGTLLVGYARAA